VKERGDLGVRGKANKLSLGERITFSRGEETCWIAGAMGHQDLYKAKFYYTCDSTEFRKAFLELSVN
jgi:hypothetical protein